LEDFISQWYCLRGEGQSKDKAMSHKRMREEEARLEAEIAGLLMKAETEDAEEDRRYGRDKRGDELPAGAGVQGGLTGEDQRSQGRP